MQSAGHAAAQSEQPTHFSSPFSCFQSRCRPRKRGYTGRLYSGYCCVIGFRKICRNVTPNPLRVSIGCGHHSATTRIAVTTALIVATGSRTFQPKRISWS